MDIHQAVIEGDEKQVAHFAKSERVLHLCDEQGYNAVELARLLGKRELLSLMGREEVCSFRVRKKNEKVFSHLSVAEFEQFFSIRYMSTLQFPSYQAMQKVVKLCPYWLSEGPLGQENREGGERYRQLVSCGFYKEVAIQWIDQTLGYGLFAQEAIEKGEFVGEYTGLVRPLRRFPSDKNGYCLKYLTRFFSWNYFVIDAKEGGNYSRFINHSDNPNLSPLCLYDRGLLHFVFVANYPICPGAHLTVDYGKDFWKFRKKVWP